MEFDYSNYKQPLQPVKNGYGYYGTLAHTKDGRAVQCHICGNTFEHLGAHVMGGHKMKALEYKETFGLSTQTGLLSKGLRLKYQQAFQRNIKAKRQMAETAKAWKRGDYPRPAPHGQKLSLEAQNKVGSCKLQVTAKIKRLARKLGYTPSPREYRDEYNGTRAGYSSVIRHFGTWEDAMIACELRPRNEQIAEQYKPQSLKKSLKDFYTKHGRVPTSADFRNDENLFNETLYRKVFGTLNDARKAAGIPQLKRVGYGRWARTVEVR